MPATLVAAPHNRHHRAGCIRHARKRMIHIPAVICRRFRSGARLISEWLRPKARRPPGHSTAGGSLVDPRFPSYTVCFPSSVLTNCRFVTELILGFVGERQQEKQRPLSDCSGHAFHKTQFVVGARDSATSSFLARSWFTCRCRVRRKSGCGSTPGSSGSGNHRSRRPHKEARSGSEETEGLSPPVLQRVEVRTPFVTTKENGKKRGPALPAPALLTRSPSKDDVGANPSGACRGES